MTPLVVRLFYVGEGDCIVIELPDGEIGLLDSCVPPWYNASPALEYLRRRRRVSFMCLTHPHLDHYGGMLQIATDQAIQIEEFWHPFYANLYEIVEYKNYCWDYAGFSAFAKPCEYENRAAEFPMLMDWARNLPPGKERTITPGKVMRSVGGQHKYEIIGLAPSDLAMSLYVKKIRDAWEGNGDVDARHENRVSAVLLIRYGDARVIFGADVFKANWREIINGRIFQANEDAAHCLKASHHGSRHGFYEQMWPILVRGGGHVVVSAGSYRLPSEQFVKSISRNRDHFTTWCTGRGACCHTPGGDGAFRHLDDFSTEEMAKPCSGNIEVKVFPTGNVEILSEISPDHLCRR